MANKVVITSSVWNGDYKSCCVLLAEVDSSGKIVINSNGEIGTNRGSVPELFCKELKCLGRIPNNPRNIRDWFIWLMLGGDSFDVPFKR